MTVPFTTEAGLNAGYAKIQDEGSFIGMANSAILCTHPVNYNAYYNSSMTNNDYLCEEEDLPINPPDWDSKWYSPVCRSWFKDQRDNPSHGTLSDLYTFAEGELGLTQCAPIIEQT